jgi:hypothetical protein
MFFIFNGEWNMFFQFAEDCPAGQAVAAVSCHRFVVRPHQFVNCPATTGIFLCSPKKTDQPEGERMAGWDGRAVVALQEKEGGVAAKPGTPSNRSTLRQPGEPARYTALVAQEIGPAFYVATIR